MGFWGRASSHPRRGWDAKPPQDLGFLRLRQARNGASPCCGPFWSYWSSSRSRYSSLAAHAAVGAASERWRCGRGSGGRDALGLDVFLNNNIWLATAFALSLVTAAFGLLFLLAWLEPSRRTRATPRRARPVAIGVAEMALPVRPPTAPPQPVGQTYSGLGARAGSPTGTQPVVGPHKGPRVASA